jgi:membrane-bound serine protease (ClpP class)
MELFLLNPNVAYLMLVAGFLLAVLALFSPGTGILEIGALFLLVLAGYSIANQPINWWALILLVLGVFPFLLALRRSKRWWFLLVSMAALVLGSVFLIRPQDGVLAVNPWLAALTSAASIGLLWLIGTRGMEALRRPKASLDDVVGLLGEARTDVHMDGTVYLGGEEWTARSAAFIPAGSRVKAVRREGLSLVVEKADE